MTVKQVSEIVEAVRAHGGYIIDDDAPVHSSFKPVALGIMKTSEGERVIPIFHSWKFPNTPIYIGADGKPHMRKVDKQIFTTEGIQAFDLAGQKAEITLVVEN